MLENFTLHIWQSDILRIRRQSLNPDRGYSTLFVLPLAIETTFLTVGAGLTQAV
jgi:hypothetical protein